MACGEGEVASLLRTVHGQRCAERELQMGRRWERPSTSRSSRTWRHTFVASTWAWKEMPFSMARPSQASLTVQWCHPEGHRHGSPKVATRLFTDTYQTLTGFSNEAIRFWDYSYEIF